MKKAKEEIALKNAASANGPNNGNRYGSSNNNNSNGDSVNRSNILNYFTNTTGKGLHSATKVVSANPIPTCRSAEKEKEIPEKTRSVVQEVYSESSDDDNDDDDDTSDNNNNNNDDYEDCEPASELTSSNVDDVKEHECVKIDHSEVINSPLTNAIITAFRTHGANINNKSDKILCVIKASEIMLTELQVDTKRFYSGFLSEVTMAAQNGWKLNDKLQGYDAKSSDGKKKEGKNTTSPLGERANVNFVLPKFSSKTKRLDAMLKDKGDIIHIYHNYSPTSTNAYKLGTEFFCFYTDIKGHGSGCRVNIGAVSCIHCTKIHRIQRLMELEAEWKEWRKLSEEEKADRKIDWEGKFKQEVVATCPAKKNKINN